MQNKDEPSVPDQGLSAGRVLPGGVRTGEHQMMRDSLVYVSFLAVSDFGQARD